MNDTSSRSHCILTFHLTQTISSSTLTPTSNFADSNSNSRRSKIHFVDLAGSERIKRAGSDEIKETIFINSSLTSLNNCIRALSNPNPKIHHVPYRASPLTWYLQDSLGGASKTIFIATISPAQIDKGESLNTVKYASFAKKLTVTKEDAKQLMEERKARQMQSSKDTTVADVNEHILVHS